MKYHVVVLRQARLDAQLIFDWISERSPDGAVRWFQAYESALNGLEHNPQRHGLAPEDEDHPLEIRQLIFKTRHGRPYRALFTIAQDTVNVLHVRGPGQRLLDAGEV
jgi:plasmid stabilization system protein ParE